MSLELKAIKDKAASECSRTNRYVFGRPGGKVSGAVYVIKDMELPDVLVIRFKEEEEIMTKEKGE